MIMKKFSLLLCGTIAALMMNAQLKIDNAVFFIGAGATVTVQGDVTSNVSIQGTGVLQLKGTSLQNVDMGGNTIPNLELDNTSNATLLNTNTRVGTSMLFTNGKFQTGNLNFILAPGATVTGQNTSRFFQTNGTGQLMKELTGDIAGYELPVGENNNYRPAYLTTSGAAYSSASFGVRVLGAVDADKPPMITTYINTNWPVSRTGITGGTVTLAGQYIDPTDVTLGGGPETNLRGYFKAVGGTDWTSVGGTNDAALNRVGAPVTTTTGVLTGMNKFLTVGARAFLQGAYDPISGLMADNGLRTLPFGPASSNSNFPQDDPYRQATYSGAFTHVNNSNVETIPSSGVIGAQADAGNNIVDWVFLQLRDLAASPGNTVLQTRSALIQRDGDIVDIDGNSPVTFNNIPDGNYILTIRHRNHLGLSLDQTAPKNFTETKSLAFDASKVADLRTALDAQIFGTTSAYTTAAHPSLSTVNLLWGGNANFNTTSRFTGLNNDRDHLLITTLGNNPSNFITNTYNAADVNLNKAVRFTGLSNDRDFLLITVLGNNPSNFRTQAIPN
jgi:hypothetical protein